MNQPRDSGDLNKTREGEPGEIPKQNDLEQLERIATQETENYLRQFLTENLISREEYQIILRDVLEKIQLRHQTKQ